MEYMTLRRMPETHAYEIGAYEMHAREVDAHDGTIRGHHNIPPYANQHSGMPGWG
jgi:hypothetical protein